MNNQTVRASLLLLFLTTIFIFTMGLTYILSDIQKRLGAIEHYLIHHKGLVPPCDILKSQ